MFYLWKLYYYCFSLSLCIVYVDYANVVFKLFSSWCLGMYYRNVYDFYAPQNISGEHIVAGLSVRPSVSLSVRPKFVSGP